MTHIWGIHAVTEALKAGRVVSVRAGRRSDRRLQELLALAGREPPRDEICQRRDIASRKP